MEPTEFFLAINESMAVVFPMMALGVGITIALGVLGVVLRAMTEAFRQGADVAELAATIDQRKKKKEEYDSYYDERLAMDSDNPNIAYYEESEYQAGRK
jgi:hypothetical protein